MKNSIFTVLAALVLYPAGAQPVTPQDRRRAAELVERMTLDEKIGQLVQQRGGGAVTGPDKTELSVERLVREGPAAAYSTSSPSRRPSGCSGSPSRRAGWASRC